MNWYANLIKEGLWKNNPGLVQLLGLCPLLAVSGTVINGLGMGLATLVTLLVSNALVSLVRDVVKSEIRIPVFVLIIASTVTAIELAMNAWFYDLYKILGIFVPLIVTNCIIIGRAEAFAAKNKLLDSVVDALAMGIGFTLVLVILGGFRELLGQGTLLAHAHLMFGDGAKNLVFTLSENYRGFLLAALPPGAFIAMGLLIAVKNLIDAKLERRQKILADKGIQVTAS